MQDRKEWKKEYTDKKYLRTSVVITKSIKKVDLFLLLLLLLLLFLFSFIVINFNINIIIISYVISILYGNNIKKIKENLLRFKSQIKKI